MESISLIIFVMMLLVVFNSSSPVPEPIEVSEETYLIPKNITTTACRPSRELFHKNICNSKYLDRIIITTNTAKDRFKQIKAWRGSVYRDVKKERGSQIKEERLKTKKYMEKVIEEIKTSTQTDRMKTLLTKYYSDLSVLYRGVKTLMSFRNDLENMEEKRRNFSSLEYDIKRLREEIVGNRKDVCEVSETEQHLPLTISYQTESFRQAFEEFKFIVVMEEEMRDWLQQIKKTAKSVCGHRNQGKGKGKKKKKKENLNQKKTKKNRPKSPKSIV